MFSNGKRISKSILTVIAGLGVSTSVSFAQTGRVMIIQRNFVEEGPVDRQARELFNAGQKFYDQYRYVDAERTFREVIQKYPKSSIADRAEYYLIRTLAQSGKRPEALERINAFPKTYPKSAWNADVQEKKIELTNQLPPRAEAILVRQVSIPPAPANPPSPPAPFGRKISAEGIRVGVMPFGAIGGFPQSADPQISLQQEVMRAIFRSDV